MPEKIMNVVFIILQVVLPKHLLSRWLAHAGDTRIIWIKNTLINLAIDAFNINVEEAVSADPNDYESFNDFFMRRLKAGARPVDSSTNSIISPADGLVSQCGKIEKNLLIQAKGKYFDLKSLLAGDEQLANYFEDGHFATIYLSPRDYHRVHMANKGQLRQSIYVPGELFSVNQTTAEHIRNLFARNERLINVFSNEQGLSISIMVGAMLVAGIETVWAGQVVPPKAAISTFNTQQQKDIVLDKGEEMGRFKFGSTVILLFPKDSIEWNEHFQAGTPVKMGEAIGRYIKEKN